ncbi:MAG: hypothetical protein AAGL10_15480 [Pseudomonadota bacterium]
MINFRAVCLAVTAISLTASGSAQAAPPSGWQAVSNNDVGDVFSGPNGSTMRVASRAELEAGCSCSLPIEGQAWGEDALLEALAIMWVDVDQHQMRGTGTRTTMRGTGMNEDGDVVFAARAVGDAVHVLLARNAAGLTKSDALLSANWGTSGARSARSVATAAAQPTRPAAPRATSAKVGRYSPPANLSVAGKWPKKGQWWATQKPNDPASPRFASGQTGPKYDVTSFAGTVGAMEKYFGVKFKASPKYEKIEAWQSLDGSDFRIAFAPTDLNGVDGVAFILVKKARGSDLFQMNVFEMPRQTFVEWGGAARMIVIRGLLPSMDVFPKAERSRIARGSLSSQTAFYEAAATKFFEMKSAQTYAMTQTNLLLGMQELNYDLLFGNDIGTSVIDY